MIRRTNLGQHSMVSFPTSTALPPWLWCGWAVVLYYSLLLVLPLVVLMLVVLLLVPEKKKKNYSHYDTNTGTSTICRSARNPRAMRPSVWGSIPVRDQEGGVWSIFYQRQNCLFSTETIGSLPGKIYTLMYNNIYIYKSFLPSPNTQYFLVVPGGSR